MGALKEPATGVKLYNTLGRKLEEFTPSKGKKVTLYTCGPTVYDAAHIGNLRTYVWEDTLRRWLKYGHNYEVKQAMNITDVEDKIIAASKAKTVEEMDAFTAPFLERFFADIDALGIEQAEQYPKATEYVEKMIDFINRIIEKGFAYERDGSVYFEVQKYHEAHGYGKLLNIDFAGFEQGHRIDNDEYDKESVQDFALWKAAPKDTPRWDSPWGYGRPGWHIECSAMAKADLGETIDIHTGAIDNIFPHHENEIAQSQAAQGKPLSRFWLHAEHLRVDGEKMAKSAGNFYTLTEVTEKGFTPAHLRMLYLTAHYRSKLNFTWDSLAAAKESYDRIQGFLLRLSEAKPGGTKRPEAVTALGETARSKLQQSMDDDLNTAEALAGLFDFIRDLNTLMDKGELDEGEVEGVREVLTDFDQVLGVVSPQTIEVPPDVQSLVDEREGARKGGDFSESDRLRDQIAALGFSVEDTDHGPRVRKNSQ